MDEREFNEGLPHARAFLPNDHSLHLIALALAWGREVTILPVPGREPWRRTDLMNASKREPEPLQPVRSLVKSANI